jgi:polysaccharide biosynthesis protein PslG
VIRKLALIAVALTIAAPAPAGAEGLAPKGFLGISPQSPPSESDFSLMERSDLDKMRWPLNWSAVETASPFSAEPDWDGFDHGVRLAATYGMRVLPVVASTPTWVDPEYRQEPVNGLYQRRAWASFLRRAIRRYGSDGVFWREHPNLAYHPIRVWEIWNEPNIVTFGTADPASFARLIRISGRVLHKTDPGAKLILGGFFGRPLQVPPNLHPGSFLTRLYKAGGMKRWFDGVGLHPYVASATAIRGQIRTLRRVMRLHGDAGTPLYITEMGWGSDSFESRWERGMEGQAEELDRAMSMLVNNRRAWRIGGVWWFSWADVTGACQFCDSAGLLTEDREAKPSWYLFNEWTGGEADTVPRLALGD